MRKQSLRTGYSAGSYVGIAQDNPPDLLRVDRNPTLHDYENFDIGCLWINRQTLDILMLVKKEVKRDEYINYATWIKFGTSIIGTTYFVADSGYAEQSGGDINILGASAVLDTSASGSTVSVNVTNGTDGQLIIAGGTEPIWSNITSPLASVAITNSANSINLEAVGISTILKIAGDSSFATPDSGSITIAGGTNIGTVGLADDLTINLDDDVTIANSLTVSGLSTGIAQTDNSGLISSSAGADGEILISATSGDPAWANITSTGGTATISNGSNSINIEANGSAPAPTAHSFLCVCNFTSTSYGSSNYGHLGNSMQVIFDTGSNLNFYNAGPGKAILYFLAPVTGRYFFSAQLNIVADGIDKKSYPPFLLVRTAIQVGNGPPYFSRISYFESLDYENMHIVTTGSTYYNYEVNCNKNISAYVDMTAGNTCKIFYEARTFYDIYRPNVYYHGGTAIDSKTYFCGHYVG